MNFSNIISEIEKTDPEVYQKIDSRRGVMRNFFRFSGKIATAAVPFAIGGMFKKAYASSTDAITDVFQFALTLEYLEAEFYNKVLAAPGLALTLTGNVRAGIQTISTHENAHVNFLKNTLVALGQTPGAKPNFDFSAGGSAAGTGPFSGVNSPFVNYGIMLAMSQVFEDTGVRAYKGQAPTLVHNAALDPALQIHSVEGRHASHIRKVRFETGAAVKPWITLNQSGIPAPFAAAVQASYNGEDNTTQGGVQIVNIGGQSISANAASESFDEPLTKAQVLAIVTPFIY